MQKRPEGHRYEEMMYLICAYFLIIAGPLFWENFSANMPVPKISALKAFINKDKVKVIEGCLRVYALKKFLEDRGYPFRVFLSEDGTRICNRVQYDVKTNLVVGLVLEIVENTSMPKTFCFKATSAAAMAGYFKNNVRASILYTYMVQPVVKNAPAFCLMLFGTDNKFQSENVVQWWKYICNILKSHGIEVIGMAADGDSRVLKAMQDVSKLGQCRRAIESSTHKSRSKKRRIATLQEPENDFLPGFHAALNLSQICVQDSVLIGSKFKNRLFNDSFLFPMGNYFATAGDIKALYRLLSKDKHLLI